MVNIPKSDWVCAECSGGAKSLSFSEYCKSVVGQQQTALEFLNLPYKTYKDFIEENAEALSLFSPSSFNAIRQKAINQQPKKTLFSVGSILFVRSPERNDWRLPTPMLTEEEYVSQHSSVVVVLSSYLSFLICSIIQRYVSLGIFC